MREGRALCMGPGQKNGVTGTVEDTMRNPTLPDSKNFSPTVRQGLEP